MIHKKSLPFLSSLFSAKDLVLRNLFEQASSIEELRDALLKAHNPTRTNLTSFFPSVYFLNTETIQIEKGVQIAPGALIEGPCYLGENVTIGHCALIRKGTFLASNVHIGHCSERKRFCAIEQRGEIAEIKKAI